MRKTLLSLGWWCLHPGSRTQLGHLHGKGESLDHFKQELGRKICGIDFQHLNTAGLYHFESIEAAQDVSKAHGLVMLPLDTSKRQISTVQLEERVQGNVFFVWKIERFFELCCQRTLK